MPTVTTNVTELPESRVRVSAEVSADEVERQLLQAARRLGSELRIPGFRKGKVPPAVVIRRLGREAVLDEAVRRSLGNWYVDAIDGSGIAPIGEPDLDIRRPARGQGEPLAFSIEIGVRPEATLGEYKGIEVGRREPKVEDAAIDEQLQQLRNRVATLETVERPAAAGDHLVVDYVGTLDGEEFEGGAGRDQLVELGAGKLIPGFEEQLLGASAGDTKTVEVTFPDDYPSEEMQGQAATFEVTVHEVKAKQLPELDDDFAAEASEFDTVSTSCAMTSARGWPRSTRPPSNASSSRRCWRPSPTTPPSTCQRRWCTRARTRWSIRCCTRSSTRGSPRRSTCRSRARPSTSSPRRPSPRPRPRCGAKRCSPRSSPPKQIEPTDEQLTDALAPVAQRDGSDPAELLERLRKQRPDRPAARGRGDPPGARAARLGREADPDRAGQGARGAVDPRQGRGRGPLEATGKLWTPGS